MLIGIGGYCVHHHNKYFENIAYINKFIDEIPDLYYYEEKNLEEWNDE